MKPLTDEQKQLCQDNINLVYRFMNENHFRIGARRDQVLSALHIALMRTAQKFNAKIGTFSTLAYINFGAAIRDVERSAGAKKHQFKSLTSFETQNEGQSWDNSFSHCVRINGKFANLSEHYEFERKKELELSVDDCREFLTPKLKVVLDLRLQGWSNQQIGDHFEPKVSRERVRQYVSQIGEKLELVKKARGE